MGDLVGHCGWGMGGLQVWPPGGQSCPGWPRVRGDSLAVEKVGLFLMGSGHGVLSSEEKFEQRHTHSLTYSLTQTFPNPHCVPWPVLATDVSLCPDLTELTASNEDK